MRIYFGEASDRDVEVFGTEGLLENRGSYFNYMVEYGSNSGGLDDVVIHDGCGRSIPVSVDHLRALCRVLVECNNIHTEIREASELQEFAESEDNSVHVCEQGHIHY